MLLRVGLRGSYQVVTWNVCTNFATKTLQNNSIFWISKRVPEQDQKPTCSASRSSAEIASPSPASLIKGDMKNKSLSTLERKRENAQRISTQQQRQMTRYDMTPFRILDDGLSFQKWFEKFQGNRPSPFAGNKFKQFREVVQLENLFRAKMLLSKKVPPHSNYYTKTSIARVVKGAIKRLLIISTISWY